MRAAPFTIVLMVIVIINICYGPTLRIVSVILRCLSLSLTIEAIRSTFSSTVVNDMSTDMTPRTVVLYLWRIVVGVVVYGVVGSCKLWFDISWILKAGSDGVSWFGAQFT
jgi:hypothetical protein